jgi:RNA polymerase sigma factor (TIGR02999 family)
MPDSLYDNSTEELMEVFYYELKGLAARQLQAEQADHTLQTTALVHEAYLRLRNSKNEHRWSGRSAFVAAAGEAMRRILVDHARARLTAKRGGKCQRQPLGDPPFALPLPAAELVAVHEALEKYELEDPRKAQLVQLRVFAGLNQRQAANEMGISLKTADRYWTVAKLRLYSMMR